MRRFLLPATAALAVATAFALVGVALVIRPPDFPAEAAGPSEAANRALVQTFYDAANAAIATGDASPLAALIDPGFVDRGFAADAEPDRDGLVRRLLAVHAAAAAARLAVEAMAADGDLVLAHVRVDGVAPVGFLGVPVDDASVLWGPLDVFRIDGGRIVERWGPVGDLAPVAPLLRVALDVPPPGFRALAVTRVVLEPGARHVAPARGGPRLVVTETGAISVAAIPTASYGASPATLRAGEHLLLATRTRLAARNIGPSSATLLDIAIAAPPPTNMSAPPPAAPEDGVAVEVLAEDLLLSVPAGPVVLSIGRATLEPGETIEWADLAGPVLVHVDAGTGDLAAIGSVSWVRSVVDERSTAGVEAVLAAGGGALFEAGAAVEVRAAPAVPATLLVVTLLPG